MAVHHSLGLGALLKHYRIATGLTQEELAERAKVSVRSISDLERGRQRTPYRDTVSRLAVALELVGQDYAEFEAAARLPPDPGPVAGSAETPLPIGKLLGTLPDGPLVGREEELDRIEWALDAAARGSGQLVLLAGEPGIGKTRLAQEVMLRVQKRAFVAAVGRCHEEDQTVPLHPFRDALDTVRASAPPSVQMRTTEQWSLLERLLTDGTGPPADGAIHERATRLRLFEHVAGFLMAVAREQPIALLLDDLQWADEASLDLVRHLTRRTLGHRIFLFATCRFSDVGDERALEHVVRDLVREGLIERIAMHRLTREGTGELMAARIAALQEAEEFVEFVHRRSKGNPLYIEKMVHALGGHYRLVRQIGAGGMGQVFEAIDARSGEHVAAKIMLARTETDPRARLRFEQEGAVLATLDHPNIVRLYDTFLEEHASYIIMEFIQGQSLGQLLGATRLDLPRIKHLMLQVVAALQFAHSRAIVHRDIKPDNIMVSEQDHVKVTDFGIARMFRPIDALSTMTSTGMTMGTPLYMAPEQIRGKKVDGRTDIYALGCTLYRLVTGQPPFRGDDPLAVALQHVLETPRPPREINDAIPQDWETLILKMMAKEPDQRVSSAEALSREIAALCGDVAAGTGAPSQTGSRAPVPSTRTAIAAASDSGGHGPVPAPDNDTNRSEASRDSLAASISHRMGKKVREVGANHRLRLPLVGGAVAIVSMVIAGAMVVSGSGYSHTVTTMGRVVPYWGSTTLETRPLRSPSGVAVGVHGYVYVADTRNNRIVELSATGLRLAQWGTPGSGPGQFNQPRGVAVDTRGHVYVADTGNHRVQEFSSGGQWLRQWFGPTGLGRDFDPLGLALDGRGNMYVVDAADGDHPSQLDMVSRGGGTRVEHWAVGDPAGVTVDVHGAVYIADANGGTIRKLSPGGNPLATWHSRLNHPASVAVDHRDNVYVADTGSSHVQKFSSTGHLVAVWGAAGSGIHKLQSPGALAVDGRGNIYVADTGNNRIVKLSSAGVESGEWDSRLSVSHSPPRLRYMAVDTHDTIWAAGKDQPRIYQFSPSGLPLLNWKLPNSIGSSITGMAVDTGGSVYVSYMNENRIARFSSRGRFVTQWGSTGSGPGSFDNPSGVAVDRRGNVYVADTNNDRIQKFSSMGQTLQQWGKHGSAPGQFNKPVALTVDRRGNVWVVDNGNNRIDELSPAGKPLSIWGTAGSGPGQFESPSSIAVDTAGDVYVADTVNNRLQKFSPDGRLLAVSGGTGFRPGEFVAPTEVVVDSHARVYVLDVRGLTKLAPG